MDRQQRIRLTTYDKFVEEQRRIFFSSGRMSTNNGGSCCNSISISPPRRCQQSKQLIQKSHKKTESDAKQRSELVCQCCYESLDSTVITKAAAAQRERPQPHQQAHQEQRPQNQPCFTCEQQRQQHHTICNTCVTKYVRGWLHDGSYRYSKLGDAGVRRLNEFGVILIPCIGCAISATPGASTPIESCDSYLIIPDKKLNLTSREVTQLRQRLTASADGMSISAAVPPSHSGGSACVTGADTAACYNEPLSNLQLLEKQQVLAKSFDKRRSFGASKRKESILKVTNEIDEIKTSAIVRICPNPHCSYSFIKTDGCNKMTCPCCDTTICFCCRKQLPNDGGYEHFFVIGKDDNRPNNNANQPKNNIVSWKRCPLWTDETMDLQLQREYVKAKLYNMAQQVKK